MKLLMKINQRAEDLTKAMRWMYIHGLVDLEDLFRFCQANGTQAF